VLLGCAPGRGVGGGWIRRMSTPEAMSALSRREALTRG
jgi:hypothetical protein